MHHFINSGIRGELPEVAVVDSFFLHGNIVFGQNITVNLCTFLFKGGALQTGNQIDSTTVVNLDDMAYQSRKGVRISIVQIVAAGNLLIQREYRDSVGACFERKRHRNGFVLNRFCQNQEPVEHVKGNQLEDTFLSLVMVILIAQLPSAGKYQQFAAVARSLLFQTIQKVGETELIQ